MQSGNFVRKSRRSIVYGIREGRYPRADRLIGDWIKLSEERR